MNELICFVLTELLCCTAPAGGAVTGRQSSSGGGVRCLGDSYYMSADVSQFEPHDVVVMAFNHHVVIQAQKVCVCVRSTAESLAAELFTSVCVVRSWPFLHLVALHVG